MCNSCSVKSFSLKKKSIDLYNIDKDMYTSWYIHKKTYLQTHMPLYRTVENRSEAKPAEEKLQKQGHVCKIQ